MINSFSLFIQMYIGTWILTNDKIPLTVYNLFQNKWLLLNNKNVYADGILFEDNTVTIPLHGNDKYSLADIQWIRRLIMRIGFYEKHFEETKVVFRTC